MLLVATAVLLAGILAMRKLAPELIASLNQAFSPWVISPATTTNYSSIIRAEDEVLSQFTAAFLTGPAARLPSDTVAAPSPGTGDTIAEFHTRAARLSAAALSPRAPWSADCH